MISRTGFGMAMRGRGADTTARAGDDGDLVFQVHRLSARSVASA
jgi:hypothetical protein